MRLLNFFLSFFPHPSRVVSRETLEGDEGGRSHARDDENGNTKLD